MSVALCVWAVNAVSTFCLVGLIWTVQLVHYPGFAYVDAGRFHDFEAMHQRRISYVVVPLMLLELVSGVVLLLTRPEFFSFGAALVGCILILVVWLSTFLLQVPLHNRLVKSYDPDAAVGLVRTNWVRTIAWTLRGVLLTVWIGASL